MKALDEEIPRLEIGLGGDRFWKFFVAKIGYVPGDEN